MKKLLVTKKYILNMGLLVSFICGPIHSQENLNYPDSSYAEKYDVKYLQKLASKKEWREIVQKADTIELDKRTLAWNKTVDKAVFNLLKSYLVRKHNLIDAYMLDFIFNNYPQFLKTKKVEELVKKVTLKFLYNCTTVNYRTRYDQYCGNFFDDHYKKLPNDPGYLFEVGKNIQKYQSGKFALKYYSRSLQIKYIAQACIDKGVLETTDNALDKKRTSLEFKYAQRILFDKCFGDLKTDLIDRTLSRASGRSPLYLENICRELKSKKVVFPKKSKCRRH